MLKLVPYLLQFILRLLYHYLHEKPSLSIDGISQIKLLFVNIYWFPWLIVKTNQHLERARTSMYTPGRQHGFLFVWLQDGLQRGEVTSVKLWMKRLRSVI